MTAPSHPARRVSHLALVIDDPVPTHNFWTEVMGLRYSTCFLSDYNHGTGEFEPYLHTFYTLPDGTSIAYFVMLPGGPQLGPDWVRHPARHFGLAVEQAEDLPRWAEHLRRHGVEVQEDYERERGPALYFCDPNGIRFELTVASPSIRPEDEQAAQEILQSWLAETRQGALR
jgi:catechol 2,3-dioxygenase-like lactoylglutathione lyase family enzyme